MGVPAAFTAQLEKFSLMPPREARVAAFHFVRDIAYGDIGSRNPFDVLDAKKGTCSGKHALLKLFLEGLGYEVRTCFARHVFSRFPIRPWPQELADFQSKTLTDYHDFLQVKVDGTWLAIDAIFDVPTQAWGFPVTDWDGETNMALPVDAQEVFPAEGEPEEHKKSLIAALPKQVQKDRQAFLGVLTKMLDAKRSRSG